MQLDWRKQTRSEISQNGGTLPPKTEVWLSSRAHRKRPQGYEVREVVPKFCGRWAEKHLPTAVWSCDAVKSTPNGVSSYRSNGSWALAESKKPRRAAVFDAFVFHSDNAIAPTARILSHALEIKEATTRSGMRVGIPSLAELIHGAKVALGFESDRKIIQVTRAPVDPSVTIELLQGSALFDDLVAFAESYRDADPKRLKSGRPPPPTRFWTAEPRATTLATHRSVIRVDRTIETLDLLGRRGTLELVG
jgi:hypothetical protein